jgi:hypothetical protein
MEFCMSHVLFRLRQYFKHFSSGKQREMGFIKRFSHANYYVSLYNIGSRPALYLCTKSLHCSFISVLSYRYSSL